VSSKLSARESAKKKLIDPEKMAVLPSLNLLAFARGFRDGRRPNVSMIE